MTGTKYKLSLRTGYVEEGIMYKKIKRQKNKEFKNRVHLT